MPSTQTGTDSAPASVVTARMIAALSRFALMLVTKLRSILMMSNGSERRCDERREAGAEIVEREADALVLEAGDDRPREIHVREQRAFGDLDHQPLGREAGLRQDPDDALGKPAVGKLGRRDVDRDLDRRIPVRRLAQRFGDHLLGKPPDQADLLGNGNEDVRTDDAGERMVPARQHLEADDLAGREVDLRLEVRNELAVLEAEADALLDLAVSDQRTLHAGVEPDRPRDAAAAGMIHRDVGAAQDVGNADFGRRRRSDAGEGADLDDPVVRRAAAG